MLENYQNNYLESLGSGLDEFSEMTCSERAFLSGAIRKFKPKKILELGVAAGASSAIILNAIKDLEDAALYSIDYSAEYYRKKEKNSGYIVKEKYPELANKWKLYTGGPACNFLDEIGNDIDFCLLDTTHCLPGEILDFLMILPFLKENAVIVIHDIAIHTFASYRNNYSCGILISLLRGEKILPRNSEHDYGPNIGAVVLSNDIEDIIWGIFYALTLPWGDFTFKDKEFIEIVSFLERFYSKEHVVFLKKAIEFNLATKLKIISAPKELEKTKIKYLSYCILSKLTFGKTRNKFKSKQNSSRDKIRKAKEFLKTQ